MVENHKHTGTDSPQLSMADMLENLQTNITLLSYTAGATYSANEQAMLQAIQTTLNSVITTLRTAKIIRDI